MEKRVISTQVQEEDIKIEKSLRPQTLDDYIGQQKAKENLKIYIYGHELQICGGILNFEDELDITLIHQDLRFIGYEYSGHKYELAESVVPFPDNAVVLVSCIYPYRFDNITNNLMELGLKREQIIHIRPLAEKLLNVSADYFSQNGMDKKVKTLFDSIGRDISKIRYLDIGSNTWLLYNNSYMFYRAGSNGVLVEANPDFVDEIKRNRPRDNAIMCGCSDVRSEEEWTYYKTKHAGYNTFVKEVADTYEGRGLEVQEIKIPMNFIITMIKSEKWKQHCMMTGRRKYIGKW